MKELPSTIADVYDVWDLEKDHRVKLYKWWLMQWRDLNVCLVSNALLTTQRRELNYLCSEYERLTKQKQDFEIEAKVCVLNECKVIGMTTTGAAKYQKVIHSVQPAIIIGTTSFVRRTLIITS